MLIRKKIRLHSFEVGLRFFMTDDMNKTCKKLQKEGYDNADPEKATTQGMAGYCEIKGLTTFYCIVTIEDSLIATLKTMAHELWHINQDILEFKEVKYKKGDANETYAYTYDYLFGEAYVHVVNAWNKKYSKIKINDKDRTAKQQSIGTADDGQGISGGNNPSGKEGR